MTSQAQVWKELVAKNADLWDQYGPQGLEYQTGGKWYPAQSSFWLLMLHPMRPRQNTITVTIPRPLDTEQDGDRAILSFKDYESAETAQRAIIAAMKEQRP